MIFFWKYEEKKCKIKLKWRKKVCFFRFLAISLNRFCLCSDYGSDLVSGKYLWFLFKNFWCMEYVRIKGKRLTTKYLFLFKQQLNCNLGLCRENSCLKLFYWFFERATVKIVDVSDLNLFSLAFLQPILRCHWKPKNACKYEKKTNTFPDWI